MGDTWEMMFFFFNAFYMGNDGANDVIYIYIWFIDVLSFMVLYTLSQWNSLLWNITMFMDLKWYE